MNKAAYLKFTNLFLFISIVVQAVTGVALALDLFTGRQNIVIAMTNIHEYNGFILIVLIVVHVLLNWGWVQANFRRAR